MKWFYNLKISVKMIIGFIVVAAIAGIVGIVGIINISKIDKLYTDMYERNTVSLSQLITITETYQMTRSGLRDLIILKDDESLNKTVESLNGNYEMLMEYLKEFGKLMNDPRVIKVHEDLTSSLTSDFVPYKDKVIQLATANQNDQAYNTLTIEGVEVNKKISGAIEELTGLNIELAAKISDDNSATAKTATVIMIIIIIIGVFVSTILGIFVSGIISKPVKKLVEAADKLALGDVHVTVEATTRDEIGNLMESFSHIIENIRGQAIVAEKIAAGDMTVDVTIKSENDLLGKKLYEMVENNNEVLSSITAASEQVASGAKQISDSSIALSQGATEQASSIEQLTASIEEISSQTKQNAENANEANGLAETAKTYAEQGNEQMKEMLKAMQDINDSSTNISRIIKVIDEIASQTNMLALNAAIEAARAGEHGKGFAVVAEEVRILAERSANAAKETTDMIENSIRKAEGGTKIANETAGALNMIEEGVDKVARLVNGIAVSSNEQATGIAQINQGVMQISQVVQTNSATSEESAAASEELASQAELLKDQVSRFKLKRAAKHLSNRGLEEINPEVLRMLESRNKNKRFDESMAAEAHTEAAFADTRKIALSDSEFGKY
ncbi:HAMP domain-containing protein [Anaerocolumna sedimenticola]|uniref:HAMP domain-containing protein n=1 Tax=Anaerocolumna sedimenticola TaxID=2696063 RepID=A0A6P1TV46_9FIRM|nr:methyl-accepting chemotaxis protein [Anaerocolumna sedimenticola]QHQ63358.1 HAMP domain-containing protein [Anaerocolumna sedimenticola]